MTNNLIQALAATTVEHTNEDTNAPDYIQWATTKFRKEDGSLDVEALARGKYESDVKFIPKLLNEQSELRQDLQTRGTLEDFMTKWESARGNTTSLGNSNSSDTNQNEPIGVTPSVNPNNQSSNQLDLKALEKMFDERLERKQKESQARDNIRQVSAALVEKWGDSTTSKLDAKAASLGVSVNFLSQIAETSPKAFLELVLDKTPAPAPSTYVPPRTTNTPNTQAPLQMVSPKTKREWDQLRKTDKQKYWSPETQQALARDAAALGDAFYK